MMTENLTSWRSISLRTKIWEAPTISIPYLWEPPMKKLWRIINQAPKTRTINLCIYGSTDCGKTTWANESLLSLNEYLNLGQFGIIKITCQTNATLKGLYEQILDELQWPYTKSDNIQRLEKSLRPAFKERSSLLLVIDEFSQLQNMYKDQQVYEVLKALRNIPQWTRRPILLIGTPLILDLLEKDNDTNNRFIKFEFPRFQLKDGKWKHLQKVIKTLSGYSFNTIGVKVKDSTISSGNILELLFTRSKGKIGALIKIYERSVEVALDSSSQIITDTHFHEAIQELDRDRLLFDSNPVDIEVPEQWWNE
ncbi:MAG: TniB family NTP-binding protein [Candidatus Hodarchaeota archaeon]